MNDHRRFYFHRNRKSRSLLDQKPRFHSGKNKKRGALLCAVFTIIFSGALILQGTNASAEELTNDYIKERQEQIEQAQQEKAEISSKISDVESIKEKLEADKDDLETYVQNLDQELSDIQANIDELSNKIDEKEEEIAQTEEELEEAEAQQQQQYEDMKSRIGYIYEKGDVNYLEILASAGSFSDLMNKAAYVDALSSYDHQKLEEYKQQVELVRTTKEALEEEKDTLDTAKQAQEEEQASKEALQQEREAQVAQLEDQIGDQQETLEQYQAAAAAQDSTISALEQQVAAEKQRLSEQQKAEQKTYSGGQFVWPAPSYTYISSEFGYRVHPIYGYTRFHSGLDMAAPSGSPILAAADGTVVGASYNSSMGNYVMIDHGNGLYTIYMHASALYVTVGQSVSAGEQIAAVGSTGASTGPHLHFSVRLNGQYVDPRNYL